METIAEVNSTNGEDTIKNKITCHSNSNADSQPCGRSSPIHTTLPNASSVSVSMPPLFPRPNISNSFSKYDILTPSSTSDSLVLPSLPHTVYSNSFPLFGHPYLSTLNSAATASLFPHQSSHNPFLKFGIESIAHQLASDSSPIPSVQSGGLARGNYQPLENYSPAKNSVEELQHQALVQVTRSDLITTET